MVAANTSPYYVYPLARWTLEQALANWHRFFNTPPEQVLTGEEAYYLGPWPDEEELEGDSKP